MFRLKVKKFLILWKFRLDLVSRVAQTINLFLMLTIIAKLFSFNCWILYFVGILLLLCFAYAMDKTKFIFYYDKEIAKRSYPWLEVNRKLDQIEKKLSQQ